MALIKTWLPSFNVMSQKRIEMAINNYLDAKRKAAVAEEELERAKAHLRFAMGRRTEARIGKWVVTFKKVAKYAFDARAFQMKHPKLYGKFEAETEEKVLCVRPAADPFLTSFDSNLLA